jgi:hypothetical protein
MDGGTMDKHQVLPWKCTNSECGATLGLIRKTGRGYHQLLMYRVAISAEHQGEPPDVAAVLVGLVLDVRCSICENVQPWVPDREALVEMLARIDARKKVAVEEVKI